MKKPCSHASQLYTYGRPSGSCQAWATIGAAAGGDREHGFSPLARTRALLSAVPYLGIFLNFWPFFGPALYI